MYEGRVLTIAGSDSGGGAGIQADLKTFAAFNVFGLSVITAITAQNTLGVTAIHDIPPELVQKQLEAVMEDIGADSAKTGMLATSPIVKVVADKVKEYRIEKLVSDPVMVATDGSRLLQDEARAALVEELLPWVFVLTPNVPEAEIISGIRIRSVADAEKAAAIISRMGPKYVLVKGGHLATTNAIDILYDGRNYHYYEDDRHQTKNTHGSGCTLSAAIAASLAKGLEVEAAVSIAKDYVSRAIREAPGNLGKGHGPLYHNIEPISRHHPQALPSPRTRAS